MSRRKGRQVERIASAVYPPLVRSRFFLPHRLFAPSLIAAVAAGAIQIGCVHESAPGTWETAKKTRRILAPPSAIAPGPPPTATTTIAPDTPSGTQIDRALQDFLGVRANARGAADRDVRTSRAWHTVLESIDLACTVAPVGDDLGAFVRARATLEVELHRDQSQKRALPRDVETRLAATLASIDMRMSELRAVGAPGMIRPTPLPDGGIIVLLPPVSPLIVSSPYGIRTDPIHGRTRFHAGIDLSAPFGAPVHASAKGSVVYAGWQGGYGRHVVVDHGGGVRTHYSHMHKLYVKSGAKVGPGDTLGVVGATGRATGPHLHFAVTNIDGAFLDPGALVNQPFYAAPPDRNRVRAAEPPALSQAPPAQPSRSGFGGANR